MASNQPIASDTVTNPRNTSQLIEDLTYCSDTELALCYEISMEGEDNEIFPLYLVVAEMQFRELSFDQLEDLLSHHYA